MTMDHVEEKLHEHELECAKRYGVIHADMATLVTNQKWLTRLVWFVFTAIFTAIVGFELNAIFKFIGH